jgi:hypothetical protein
MTTLENQLLKISYTGSNSVTAKYNGVSFFGVGRGTEVSNIYTFESGDDAIEFFGCSKCL